jgi:hypothetical protein
MLATNLLILRYSTKSNVFSIDKQDIRKRSMQLLQQIDRLNCEDNNNINYYYYYYFESFTYNKIRVIENTQNYL